MSPALQPIFLAATDAAATSGVTLPTVLGYIFYVALPLAFVGSFIWYLCALSRYLRDSAKHRNRLEAVLERIAAALERKE